MQIYDCFCYRNESDLLEIRLNELNDVVDYFVICEATKTFTGLPKPLNFNINNYPQFKDKIIYIVNNTLVDKPDNTWINQINQRNFLINGVKDTIKDNDILMLSDIDEFPSAFALRNGLQLVTEDNIIIFKHGVHYYYCNYYSIDWVGAKITQYKNILSKFDGKLDNFRNHWLSINTLTYTGGWHFSSLGGDLAIKEKLNSISEQKFNTPEELPKVFERKNNGVDLIGRKMKIVDITYQTHPKYLVDNLIKFKHLIGEENNDKL